MVLQQLLSATLTESEAFGKERLTFHKRKKVSAASLAKEKRKQVLAELLQEHTMRDVSKTSMQNQLRQVERILSRVSSETGSVLAAGKH